MKKTVYWIILVLFLYLFLETSSLVGLFLLKRVRGYVYSPILTSSVSEHDQEILENLLNGRTNYLAYSPALGWTIEKDGFSELYRANSTGIRADGDYAFMPPDDIVRIAAFGDSFTHCDDVKNEDTWEAKMEAAGEGLEVMNFGVGGYGLDQAFLRYRQDGAPYNPHIVLIGFMPENTLRVVNTYRPFYFPNTGIPLTKPRFVLKNGQLKLIANPMQELSDYEKLLAHPEVILPQIGANDYYFQSPAYSKKGSLDFLPSIRLLKTVRLIYAKLSNAGWGIVGNGVFAEDSEPFRVTVAIFDQFVSTTIENDSLPIIVIFPDKGDVVRFRKNATRRYEPLLNRFRERGYQHIDVLSAFDGNNSDIATEELLNGHYTPLANELTAKYILGYLQTKGLTTRDAIARELDSLKKENH